jgi:transposase-like protein
MTRYSQAEKMEIIRLVETSELPVKQTLAELAVPRSSFYDWYRRYVDQGFAGLAQTPPQRRQFWNRIPDSVRQRVVEIALERRPRKPGKLTPMCVQPIRMPRPCILNLVTVVWDIICITLWMVGNLASF